MQVFESIVYNLNEIKFKDTKEYLDDLLTVHGFLYKNIAFFFAYDETGTMCDKAIKTFPDLKIYKQPLPSQRVELTSIFPQENGDLNLYVQPDHLSDFHLLLKKIPNPMHFPFMGVLLDQINWYGEETQKSVYSGGEINHSFHNYFNNSIRLYKEFDFGNKYNPIEIRINRTGEEGNLRPYPPMLQKLLSTLGKPCQQTVKCIFSQEEKKALDKAHQTMEEILRQNGKNQTPKDVPHFIENSLTPISGFSPKAIFSKAAKKKGYKFHRFSNGIYTYYKRNENNYTFAVEMNVIPFSSLADARISVQGCNFHHFMGETERIVIKNIGDAEEYAQTVFQLAQSLEEEYRKTLRDLYGQTPEWYKP